MPVKQLPRVLFLSLETLIISSEIGPIKISQFIFTKRKPAPPTRASSSNSSRGQSKLGYSLACLALALALHKKSEQCRRNEKTGHGNSHPLCSSLNSLTSSSPSQTQSLFCSSLPRLTKKCTSSLVVIQQVLKKMVASILFAFIISPSTDVIVDKSIHFA